MPTFSSNPKLGTSLGAMGAYVTKFDAESQVSLIGLSGQYTDTDSAVVAAIARTSFGADHHRLSMYVIAGEIKNDYDDLGSGEPLKSEDNIRAVLGRYLYRFTGDWFVGGQFVVTNYQIVGQTALDEDILDTLGLTGFEAGGVGLAVLHDSRDVQDKPSKGWLLNFNNVAYREAIAGSDDFEVYRTDFRGFWSHGEGNVVTGPAKQPMDVVEALQRLGGGLDVPFDQRRVQRLGDLQRQHGLAGAGLALDQQGALQGDGGVDRNLEIVGGDIAFGAFEAHAYSLTGPSGP